MVGLCSWSQVPSHWIATLGSLEGFARASSVKPSTRHGISCPCTYSSLCLSSGMCKGQRCGKKNWSSLAALTEESDPCIALYVLSVPKSARSLYTLLLAHRAICREIRLVMSEALLCSAPIKQHRENSFFTSKGTWNCTSLQSGLQGPLLMEFQ